MVENKIDNIKNKKGKEKITMVTCYDYTFAKIIDGLGLDIILVGDSLANVVLGLDYTYKVSFYEMINHTKSVRKGIENALILVDLPYVCVRNKNKILYYAQKFVDISKVEGIKLEWFEGCGEIVELLVKHGINVMGHVGLTPQSVRKMEEFKVKGKTAQEAYKVWKQSQEFQERGAFSIVLECVPYKISEIITNNLTIPTIGIGSGMGCDGQVLVLYDLLGMNREKKFKFVREFANLSIMIEKGIKDYIKAVKEGYFPSINESFTVKEEVLEEFKSLLKKY